MSFQKCPKCDGTGRSYSSISGNTFIEEWIPVTERLPEKADDILMKGIFGFVTTAIGRHHKGEGFVQPSQIGWYKCENVTHWMHLPNPPTL